LLFVLLCCLGLVARAAEPVTFRQVRVGAAVLSLPSNWTALPPALPLWVHLHGAPATVEKNFAEIGAPGVLLNVTLNGLSTVYADFFADPETWPKLLRDTEAALRAESPAQAWTIGPVTVSSFSAGFGGVRQLLKQPEAFARIGALVMADSIYCGYVGDPQEKRVDPELMAGFVQFAKLAVDGKKRLVISHSAQVPEGYASTTETADYLLAQLGGARETETEEWSGGLQLRSHYSSGSVEILGFAGEGPEDHIRHLRNLGLLLEHVAPIVPLRPAKTVEELRAQLAAQLENPRYRRALWGVKVVSLDTGATLFERNAALLQSPASNSKLYTAALALDRLGGDYRIVTPLLATAAPDTEGIVRGDVIVSGRGDPSWHELRENLRAVRHRAAAGRRETHRGRRDRRRHVFPRAAEWRRLDRRRSQRLLRRRDLRAHTRGQLRRAPHRAGRRSRRALHARLVAAAHRAHARQPHAHHRRRRHTPALRAAARRGKCRARFRRDATRRGGLH
jgi:hypothetical protein